MGTLITTEQAKKEIYTIRGQRVMLDSDLANLYEVETKVLNQAVKRNPDKFPKSFMFQLTKEEFEKVVTNCDHLQNLKYRPTLPYVFTEHGVLMLANVINSKKAVAVSIQIVEAFLKLRDHVLTKNPIETRIEELQKLLMLHIENNDNKFSEHEQAIRQIAMALNSLIESPKETKEIGFRTK